MVMRVLLGFAALLPLFVFAPLLVPFGRIEDGIWGNVPFNFVTHPILNYIIGRCFVAILMRFFCSQASSDGVNLSWVVMATPCLDPIVCLLIHMLFAAFGIFPVPVGFLTVCMPAMSVSVLVAVLILKRMCLLTREMWHYVAFNAVFWVTLTIQQFMLFGWFLAFPELSWELQSLSILAGAPLLLKSDWVMDKVAAYLSVRGDLVTTLKIPKLFIAFLISASLLAKAHNGWVMSLMLAVDAAKAVSGQAKLGYALSMCAAEDEIGLQSQQWRLCGYAFPDLNLILDTCRSIRGMVEEAESDPQGRLKRLNLQEVRLLNCLSRGLEYVAVLELCETGVPVLYMALLSIMQTPLGQNRDFILGTSVTPEEYHSAMVGNAFSFVIEAIVLVLTQFVCWRMLRVNMLVFTCNLLWNEFGFWIFGLSGAVIGWVVGLTGHFGGAVRG